MDIKIQKTDRLNGKIKIKGSKSQAIRALFIATLAKGTSCIVGLPNSEDVNNAIEVIKSLGIKIKKTEVKSDSFDVKITSKGAPFNIKNHIFTGSSGITTRFLLPILGLSKNPNKIITVNCTEQMQKRPIAPFLKNLEDLGLKIETNGKKIWPIKICGTLGGGKIIVDGLTSQYASSILIAGPYAKKDITICIEKLNEESYVKMTLKWLKDQKIALLHMVKKTQQTFVIKAGQKYKKISYKVPGDFSSASAIIVAGALLPGKIKLEGLDKNDLQEDKKILAILKKMGAKIEFKNTLNVQGGHALKGTIIDANNTPDLLPILAVLGTFAKGKTIIKNVPQARYKETDRIHAIVKELKEMGAKIEELTDGIVIKKSALIGTELDGHNDHRTVMALGIAGMIASGETKIKNAEAVNKTYPNFWNDIKTLGASLEKHIVLVGFKHTGKSIFGKFLAHKLNKTFVDLDEKIIEKYHALHGEKLSCREIFIKKGEKHFRDLESKVLQEEIRSSMPCILALGGGALTKPSNQKIIKNQFIIHFSAPKDLVFKRIMLHGNPPFIKNINDFEKLWEQRQKIFKKIANIHIINNGSADFKNANFTELNLVTGYPLEHTLSPAFHNAEYKKRKIKGAMLANPNRDIKTAVDLIRILDVNLTAVTIPHKETVMQFLDSIDPLAKEIGAVNTIIQKHGKLYGFNTDYFGIASALKAVKLKGKNALIIGAGGASKPVAKYLADKKAKIYCINRNKKRAINLMEKFGGKAIDFNDLENIKIDIIINATPVGMYPNIKKSPISKKYIKSHQTVVDFVYNPKDTLLIKEAKKQGARTICGDVIFKAQALKQIELYEI